MKLNETLDKTKVKLALYLFIEPGYCSPVQFYQQARDYINHSWNRDLKFWH